MKSKQQDDLWWRYEKEYNQYAKKKIQLSAYKYSCIVAQGAYAGLIVALKFIIFLLKIIEWIIHMFNNYRKNQQK